ncbi:hypothetical protein CEXT_601281 [Caerostris extrusa]|uniref:Uncharacterized protein n=1 Tax=Caerostris extrusa TaxID=172846 RepID=A0AAV4RQV4_CAEEX|nr:hypothetical protein CEXT_601281 [Caerostris extrusa]
MQILVSHFSHHGHFGGGDVDKNHPKNKRSITDGHPPFRRGMEERERKKERWIEKKESNGTRVKSIHIYCRDLLDSMAEKRRIWCESLATVLKNGAFLSLTPLKLCRKSATSIGKSPFIGNDLLFKKLTEVD